MVLSSTISYFLFDNPISSTAIDGIVKGLDFIGVHKTTTQVAQKGARIASNMAAATLSEMAKASGPFIRIAGLSGAIAVSLGAYGAHSILPKSDISPERKNALETANRYHFFHTIALMGIPLAKRPVISGSLMTAGTFIFCGCCYHYAFTGNTKIKPFTPYGGLLLIAAWLSLVF